MPVSGTFDYTVTASDIITCALEDIQAIQNGETADNADITTALRTLNLMTKEWMGKPGYAPGLKRWTRKTAYLFLQLNRNIYQLGPVAGGDYCCVANYTTGTLTAAAAGGATVVAVSAMYASPVYATATTPASTDYIGVELDDGTIDWSTVSGSPTLPGNITMAAALGSAAASGNRVFSFATTNQTVLPLDVLTCVRRDVNGIDYPMDKMGDIYEYEQITDKNSTSTPTAWFFSQGLTYGALYINCIPSTTTDVLRMTLLYPIDDEDAVGNTMAFPQQWFSALEWGLAKRLCPKFGKAWTSTMQENLDTAIGSASMVDPDTVYQYFQPGRE